MSDMTAPSYPAEQVRLHDHDRFLTVVLAPGASREHLFALYAFNLEISKIPEIVSETLIGQMRLQWWRDALDQIYAGRTIAHQVAKPLAGAIAAAGLAHAAFDRLIDAREADLDKTPPPDFAAFRAYAEGTGAPLLELALQIVGGGPSAPAAADAARLVGAAWAAIGLVRAVPFHARQHRLYLPADRLAAAGVRIGRLFDLKPDPGLRDVVRDIGEQAAGWLKAARGPIRTLPRRNRSPLLLAELAALYLAQLRRADWDPFELAKRPHPPLILDLTLRAWAKRY